MTVYYIRADNGAIKIGYTSKDVNSRLQSLSTSSPLNLEIIAYEKGGLEIEKQRHSEYFQSNIRGEWFIPSDELNRKIKELNPNYQPMPYLNKSDYAAMMLEKEKMSGRLEGIRSWYATDKVDPPKISYVSLFFGVLYIIFVVYLIELFNIRAELVTSITIFLYPLMLPGFVLAKVWHTKKILSSIR